MKSLFSSGIPSAAGGVLLGGYLVKKFHWNCKQILKRVAIMGFFSTILTAFVLAPCYPGEENQPPTPKVIIVFSFFLYAFFFILKIIVNRSSEGNPIYLLLKGISQAVFAKLTYAREIIPEPP